MAGNWIQDGHHVKVLQRPVKLIPLLFPLLLTEIRWYVSSSLSSYMLTFHLYQEQFSNGVTIISLYLNPLPDTNAPPIENSIFQVMKEASLLFCLPDNPFFLPKISGSHAVQEATYACASLLMGYRK